MCTNILISALSQTPIYEQIQNQIKEMVLRGNIKSKDQLPSIRLMSKDLKVGIITVKRAYEELEKDGIVINLQGRGCFVAEIDELELRLYTLTCFGKGSLKSKNLQTLLGYPLRKCLRL